MLQQLRQSTPSTPKAMVDAGLAEDDDASLLASKFPATMGAKFGGGSSIPDSNAIHAAKKKRELMRQGITINDDEFIPLGDGVSVFRDLANQVLIIIRSTERMVLVQEPENESRLVREEDEDGDAEDGRAHVFI